MSVYLGVFCKQPEKPRNSRVFYLSEEIWNMCKINKKCTYLVGDKVNNICDGMFMIIDLQSEKMVYIYKNAQTSENTGTLVQIRLFRPTCCTLKKIILWNFPCNITSTTEGHYLITRYLRYFPKPFFKSFVNYRIQLAHLRNAAFKLCTTLKSFPEH